MSTDSTHRLNSDELNSHFLHLITLSEQRKSPLIRFSQFQAPNLFTNPLAVLNRDFIVAQSNPEQIYLNGVKKTLESLNELLDSGIKIQHILSSNLPNEKIFKITQIIDEFRQLCENESQPIPFPMNVRVQETIQKYLQTQQLLNELLPCINTQLARFESAFLHELPLSSEIRKGSPLSQSYLESLNHETFSIIQEVVEAKEAINTLIALLRENHPIDLSSCISIERLERILQLAEEFSEELCFQKYLKSQMVVEQIDGSFQTCTSTKEKDGISKLIKYSRQFKLPSEFGTDEEFIHYFEKTLSSKSRLIIAKIKKSLHRFDTLLDIYMRINSSHEKLGYDDLIRIKSLISEYTISFAPDGPPANRLTSIYLQRAEQLHKSLRTQNNNLDSIREVLGSSSSLSCLLECEEIDHTSGQSSESPAIAALFQVIQGGGQLTALPSEVFALSCPELSERSETVELSFEGGFLNWFITNGKSDPNVETEKACLFEAYQSDLDRSIFQIDSPDGQEMQYFALGDGQRFDQALEQRIADLIDRNDPNLDSETRNARIKEQKNEIVMLCNQGGIALCTTGSGLPVMQESHFIYHRAANNGFMAVTSKTVFRLSADLKKVTITSDVMLRTDPFKPHFAKTSCCLVWDRESDTATCTTFQNPCLNYRCKSRDLDRVISVFGSFDFQSLALDR